MPIMVRGISGLLRLPFSSLLNSAERNYLFYWSRNPNKPAAEVPIFVEEARVLWGLLVIRRTLLDSPFLRLWEFRFHKR
jgi:hypothetical protein